jgi:hypothetical protein
MTWPDHPLFYVATGLFVIVALPQLVDRFAAARVVVHRRRHASTSRASS